MNPWGWLLILLIVAVFIPRYGFLALYRDWRSARDREHVEDALKHLLDRERGGRHASPESLAGTLDLPRVKVTRLIADMESQGLLETQGAQLHLTADGERWAIHIVRAHCLWERYLVDEARMPLSKIHDEAHRLEQNITDAQLDELDAALGYPTRDPHGDPIPTREGKLATVESQPITAWQADSPVRIVHIEDEPAIAYEQILAAGLRLAQVIRIIERSPGRLVLSDAETEYRLAPTVAANVSIAPLPESEIARFMIGSNDRQISRICRNGNTTHGKPVACCLWPRTQAFETDN